jgi:hypothetical protein
LHECLSASPNQEINQLDDIKESLEPSLEQVLLEIAEKQRNLKP